MKTKTILTMVISICLISAVTVGVTLAYLTASDVVVNTFTVGNLDIELVEPSYQGTEGSATTLLPGMPPIPKDPTVILTGEDAYVFMQLTIPLEFNDLIDTPVIDNQWEHLPDKSSVGVDVYAYKAGGDYQTQEGTLQPLFRELSVKDVFGESAAGAGPMEITIKAAAIQCAGNDKESALNLVDWEAIG